MRAGLSDRGAQPRDRDQGRSDDGRGAPRPARRLPRDAGKGFKGTARGPDFAGLLRYEEIDRWEPQPVAAYDYDLEICDLCVRECPIENAISLEPLSGAAGETRFRPWCTTPASAAAPAR
ncbi:MAG: hypothetical protein R3D80_08925 [Paracoccaceae bacterium]